MSKAIRNNQKVILLIPPLCTKPNKATRSLFFGGGKIRQDKIKHPGLYFKRWVYNLRRDVY